MLSFILLQRFLNYPIGNQSKRHGEQERTDECRPKNFQRVQVEPEFHVSVIQSESFRKVMGMAQNPKPEIIFPPQDNRPNWSQDVVQGNGDGGCDLAAPECPCEED